ncbi:hypothetical protein [Catellatospora sp. NPDC049133]|uniref:hypothetical protein n=1 Tax=Catellatospora sp. NPDC049133 TaxID=3155499 RepID=UPI00340C684B
MLPFCPVRPDTDQAEGLQAAQNTSHASHPARPSHPDLAEPSLLGCADVLIPAW